MEKGATVVTSASRSRSVMLPVVNWRLRDSNLRVGGGQGGWFCEM